MNKILAALFASAVSFGAFAASHSAPAASGAMGTEKSSAPMKEHAADKKAQGNQAPLKSHDNKAHDGKAHDGKSMDKKPMDKAASKPAA